MSAEQREPVTVSFTHISEDVIVPSGNLKSAKALHLFLFLVFGGFGLALSYAAKFRLFDTIFIMAISLAIPAAAFVIAKGGEWIEIDKSSKSIRRWKNKSKRKEIAPIHQTPLSCKAIKQISGGKTGMSYYHIWAGDEKKNAADLFVLPYKTPDATAQALAQSVESFLKKYLDGKNITSEQKDYVLTSF